VLRFYGWTEPAATFGYFQKFSEVEKTTPLRPLIRRPTGGGIVPHDVDWTYSFVVPPNHEWYSVAAVESYRRIHDWLRLAFAELKIETELAPSCKKSLPGQCFAGHEKFDLLWHGKKIAGAAQRRNKLGLLVQGSIQPPPLEKLEAGSRKPEAGNGSLDSARSFFEEALRVVAAKMWQNGWEEFLANEVLRRAENLAGEKFSQMSYNKRRQS